MTLTIHVANNHHNQRKQKHENAYAIHAIHKANARISIGFISSEKRPDIKIVENFF